MSYGKVNKTTGERIPYAGNASGGTSDYTDLTHKPSINSVTLSGNKTASDLSLASTTDLAGKQDKYETITYAQWQALTPAQQAEKDYYISDYPSSAITAGNVSYNNSSSGMSANNVQSAVDELKSGLTGLIGNMPTRVFKGAVPENSTIEIQLEASKLYQYYTWRDSEGYVYMGLIDTAYTGLITNHAIVKSQVDILSFIDGGNLKLEVGNASDYVAFMVLYEVSH